MKKIRNILLSLAMLFAIVVATGCSNGATATKTFVREQNGFKSTVVYTYIEKEDKVIKQNTDSELMYSALPNVKNKEDAKKILDPIVKQYEGVKGIKHSADYQEDKFVESLEVDYSNLDYEKAKKIQGFTLTGDPSKTKISMEKSEKLILTQGYKEKK